MAEIHPFPNTGHAWPHVPYASLDRELDIPAFEVEGYRLVNPPPRFRARPYPKWPGYLLLGSMCAWALGANVLAIYAVGHLAGWWA